MSLVYKAVCTRLLQVDFTERVNLCCLCLETVGESGASVDDEVVFDLHPGQPSSPLTLAEMLQFLLGETISEVMSILKAVCKQCISSAIAGFKFMKRCKDNAKKLTAVIDSLEVSLDKLSIDDKVASLYVAIQPCNNPTGMIERFYDIRRNFVPEDTAFLRFSQIVESRKQSSQASRYEINIVDKQTVCTNNKLNQTLQDLMCCKTVLDTKEMILDNPDKPNEYRCKICKELFSKSTSIRVHFFKLHRHKKSNCPKCNTAKGTQAKTARQKQPVVLLDKLKITDTEGSSEKIGKSNKDPLDTEESDNELQNQDSDHQNNEENCENNEENQNLIQVIPTELLLQERIRGKTPSPTFDKHDIDKQFIVESKTETDNCCNNCGMKFSTRARYLTHKKKFKNNDCRRCKGRGEFKCDLCNYTAFYKHLVRKHVEYKHLGLKGHVCPYCSRNCSCKAELETHLRKHTGEKPFQCHECGGKFASANGLKHHAYIHTGEYPYKCEFCNKAFRTGTRRGEHIARIHKPPTLCCKVCGDMFKVKQDLNRHVIRHYATQPVRSRKKT